jgi:hypothetical protein
MREVMIMLWWCLGMEMRMRQMMAYLGMWLEMPWEQVSSWNFARVKGSEIFMMKSLSLIRRIKKRNLIQILR